MHKGLLKLNTVAVTAAGLMTLAFSSNAEATDSVQVGHFSVPGASQGWPYVAPTVVPAQIFTPGTTSDTTNPLNVLNPASVANAGLNPNFLSTPALYGAPRPLWGSPFLPTYGGWGTGIGSAALGRIPYAGGFGLGGFGLGGFGIPAVPYVGSFGLPFVGRSLGGWGGGWGGGAWGGGWGRGWSAFSSVNYGGFGFGGIGNPAFMGTGFGGSFHGTVPNRVIQTGPSPSSGNYYQPATADPTASGGYYASGSTAVTAPAAPPTKNQPRNYYDSYGSDNNWGASGSPLPKDINSVPWAK